MLQDSPVLLRQGTDPLFDQQFLRVEPHEIDLLPELIRR